MKVCGSDTNQKKQVEDPSSDWIDQFKVLLQVFQTESCENEIRQIANLETKIKLIITAFIQFS